MAEKTKFRMKWEDDPRTFEDVYIATEPEDTLITEEDHDLVVGKYHYDKWLQEDLIEQFRNGPNVRALMKVVGRQMNEIAEFFDEIQSQKNIKDAEGVQLDGLGDILVMSRKDAGEMRPEYDGTGDMTDELYKQYLTYKQLKNANTCTYHELVQILKMFWNGPPITYEEDISVPATIILRLNVYDDIARQVLQLPVVRAGGVGLLIRAVFPDSDFYHYQGIGYTRKRIMKVYCDAPT